MTWAGPIKTVADLSGPDSPGAQPYGGVLIVKTSNVKAINGSAGTIRVPVFQVTGTILVYELYGVVLGALGNHTAASFSLYDGTTTAPITLASGTALSGALVGSSMLVTQDPLTALTYVPATAGGVGNTTNDTPVFQQNVMQQKSGATTMLQYVYTTTDAPTMGTIQFFIQYEALSANGAVTLL